MKFGIVGYGSIGKRHASIIRDHIEHDGILVYDPETTRRSEAYEWTASTEDLGGLFDWADVVIICSPSHCHAAQVRTAWFNGCHVFVEKPLALTAQDCDDLADEPSNLTSMVACNWRFNQSVKMIKNAINELKVGDPFLLQLEFGYDIHMWRDKPVSETYSGSRATGGGILLEAIHEVDLAFDLFGDFQQITGSTNRISRFSNQYDIEDVAALICTHQSPRTSVIVLDMLRSHYHRYATLVGVDGSFRVQLVPDDQMYVDQMLHFVRCIETGARPYATPRIVANYTKRILEIRNGR